MIKSGNARYSVNPRRTLTPPCEPLVSFQSTEVRRRRAAVVSKVTSFVSFLKRRASRHLGCTSRWQENSSQKVFGPKRAGEPQLHRPHVRLGSQLECQEGATLALNDNQI